MGIEYVLVPSHVKLVYYTVLWLPAYKVGGVVQYSLIPHSARCWITTTWPRYAVPVTNTNGFNSEPLTL